MPILLKFYVLPFCFLPLLAWAKPSLWKEKLPDGSQIAFYKSQTASQKQIEQIETRINSRLQNLIERSKKKPPKDNLQALRQFKKYLQKIQKNTKYQIAKSSLSVNILLLSEWLAVLPSEGSIKNCKEQTRRMKLRAHSLLQNPDKNKWLSQGLKLIKNICSKKKPKTYALKPKGP